MVKIRVSMIRIRRIVNKISLGIILGLISPPLFAQLPMGAKGLGMGEATTALPGYVWSLFANPALANNENITVGFYGLRNYGFAELTDLSAIATVPAKFGVISAGFHKYGDHLFSETQARFGYKKVWRMLHFGLVLNYSHLAFGGNYGSGSAVGLNVGIAAEISDDFWVGAKSININHPKYRGIREDLPREMAIGFSYELNEWALFAFDVVKDVNFPESYRGGVEINVIEALVGRVGITTEPLTYSLGFGYRKERWDINFAIQKHLLLGVSPGFDFMIYF